MDLAYYVVSKLKIAKYVHQTLSANHAHLITFLIKIRLVLFAVLLFLTVNLVYPQHHANIAQQITCYTQMLLVDFAQMLYLIAEIATMQRYVNLARKTML
jgi:hypothetical protein